MTLKAFLILVQFLLAFAIHSSSSLVSQTLTKALLISSCFIGQLVCMKHKVGLHGHELSVDISSFSTEFFREGCFDFHVVIFFVGLGIYVDGGMEGTRG